MGGSLQIRVPFQVPKVVRHPYKKDPLKGSLIWRTAHMILPFRWTVKSTELFGFRGLHGTRGFEVVRVFFMGLRVSGRGFLVGFSV